MHKIRFQPLVFTVHHLRRDELRRQKIRVARASLKEALVASGNISSALARYTEDWAQSQVDVPTRDELPAVSDRFWQG
jgi:hypothetical protein